MAIQIELHIEGWTVNLGSLARTFIVVPAHVKSRAHDTLSFAARETSSRATAWAIVRVGSIVALPLAQFVAILWVIWTRTAAIPYWDEWNMVGIVRAWREGQLTWADLWAPHAGAHRIVLPRLYDLVIISATDWNRQVEMTIDMVVAGAAVAILLWCIARAVGPRLWPWLVPPLGLLLLSAGQYNNWFAPFQISFIAVVFGVALCVAVFTSGSQVTWRGLVFAGVGALIASLSSMPGLCAWPAFLPAVWFSPVPAPQRKWRVALWTLTGGFLWIAYFVGFSRSAASPTGTRLSEIALFREVARYLLVWLGGSLGYPDPLHAAIWGLASICLLMVTVRVLWIVRGHIPGLAAWVGVVLFAAGALLATVVGRARDGAGEALSSRYEAFSSLWWLGLIVLTVAALREWSARYGTQFPRIQRMLSLTGKGMWFAFAVAILAVNVAGWRDGLLWQSVQRANQDWVAHTDIAPPSCLALYNPDLALVRTQAAWLRKERLGPFATSAPPATTPRWPTGGVCAKPYWTYID